MSGEMNTHKRRALLASLLGGLALLAPPLLGAWIIYLSYRGPLPRLLAQPPRAALAVVERTEASCARDSFSLAGSGSNLVLTQRLAQAFQQSHPGAPLRLHESIGSAGGIRATYDGVVDVGLVSRAFSAEESRWNLKWIPYARVAVVLATHPSVPDREISSADLLRLYAGKKASWRDGKRAIVLQREVSDSSHQVVGAALPGFAEVNRQAYLQDRWKVLYSDAAMQRALLGIEGAVGLFDLGSIVSQGLALNALALDGVAPGAQDVLTGRYPFVKPLAFAVAPPLCPRIEQWIRFVLSAPGQRLVAESGYLAPAGESR